MLRGGVARCALGPLPSTLYQPCLPKPFFLRGHQSTQAFLPSFFPMLDLLVYVLPFFSWTWCFPYFPLFLSACLYCSLFYLSAFSLFQPRSRKLAIFPLTYVIRQQIFFLGRLQSFSFSNVVAFEITSPSLSHSPSRPQCTLQS